LRDHLRDGDKDGLGRTTTEGFLPIDEQQGGQ
jgi:hypothetical protein